MTRRKPAPPAKMRAKAEPCRHPIGRRIGANCAACGEKVGDRRKASK